MRRAVAAMLITTVLSAIAAPLTAHASTYSSYWNTSVQPSSPDHFFGLSDGGNHVLNTPASCISATWTDSVGGGTPLLGCGQFGTGAQSPWPNDPTMHQSAYLGSAGTSSSTNATYAAIVASTFGDWYNPSLTTTDYAWMLWIDPQGGQNSGDREHIWSSRGNPALGCGGTSGTNSKCDGNEAVYVNSTDDLAHLCFGVVLQQGACPATSSILQGSQFQWMQIGLWWNHSTNALSLWYDGRQLSSITISTPSNIASAFGPVLGFIENYQDSWNVDIADYTEWSGAHASNVFNACGISPLCSSSSNSCNPTAGLCNYFSFMYLGVGTNQPLPQCDPAGCGPGGPGTGGPPSCNAPAPFNFTPSVPLWCPGTSDCANFDTGWNIGADINWLACEIGNTVLNAVAFIVNGVLQLAVPDVSAIQTQWNSTLTAIQTHVPFNYAYGALTYIPSAFNGAPNTPSIAFDVPAPFNFHATLTWQELFGFAQPYRGLLLAFMYLTFAAAVVLHSRHTLET